MNVVNNEFSIKDLENLSGIKAHTIRIWEKRYNLLTPDRKSSNIRFYNTQNLQKILNISLLYNSGHKISKIAKLSEKELQVLVREHIASSKKEDHLVGKLKMAMFNFDQRQFNETYNQLLIHATFREVFLKVFVPFLQQMGLQWQSDAITPAHEHFITNLIFQKLHIQIERVQQNPPNDDSRAFILFLPENEIHEIGLLYIHYELILNGYQSIYLGQSIPMENLKEIIHIYQNVQFISYFTVKPLVEEVSGYLADFKRILLCRKQDELWVLGRNIRGLKDPVEVDQIKMFNEIDDLLNKIR